MKRLLVSILAALSWAAAVQAETPPHGPRAIVERAIAAHGGEGWLEPGTLILAGEAEFYDPKTGAVRSRSNDYRMWREFDRDRQQAHSAEGKVRITARDGERLIFEVGFDGTTTWTERGILPQAEADAYWANNFGFGIIRSALAEGFVLESAPTRNVAGHEVDLVRVIDPGGQPTLFGFDRESGFIRYLGFSSPRGFHERIYDDFVRLPETGWVQAREVTLLYDGVKSNTVFWKQVAVGEPVDAAVFAPPQP
ncbi:hypothetical protein P7228_10275 [Altererythrobacter arenosus]|uniref:Outer membrane lipoprotein-sorting protein n=1 Tax=Altererythrobacter arenosus TaxID=3032592 RepID=A0ABY8FR58_9SPHN|nr:hypothetical protein [Altererythrobacter sp. CAU 1644]WFL76383.1 hypothetical protein P7228_10275 [Altererythrobacter sp. CAU 1644]